MNVWGVEKEITKRTLICSRNLKFKVGRKLSRNGNSTGWRNGDDVGDLVSRETPGKEYRFQLKP